MGGRRTDSSPASRVLRAIALLLFAPLLMGKFQDAPSCGCPGFVAKPVSKAMDAIPKPAWTLHASAPTLRPVFSAQAPERRYLLRIVVAQDPASWTDPDVTVSISTHPPAVAGRTFRSCCPPSRSGRCAYVDDLQRNAYLAVSIRDAAGNAIPTRPSCRGVAYPCGREPLRTSCSAPGYELERSLSTPGAFTCDRARGACSADVHLTLRATRPSGEGYEYMYRHHERGVTDPYPASDPPPVVLSIDAELRGPEVSHADRSKVPSQPAGVALTVDVREVG